jgi:HEPN domain-containing protein
MVQNVGLSKTDEKMLEFVAFPEGNKSVSLYVQAKAFYLAFRMVFANGYEIILAYEIPKIDVLGPSLVNYHFAVELMLKGLIALKGVTPDKTHNLIKLLTKAISHYPRLSVIYENLELKLLLQEISNIGIRYAEGATCLRHNICLEKKPLQELSEAMDHIFTTLKISFENTR